MSKKVLLLVAIAQTRFGRRELPTIGLDYTPAYEQGGGIGRYVRELVAALAKQDSDTLYHLFVAGSSSRSLLSLGSNFTWKPTRLSPRWLARLWHRAHIP